MITHIKGKFIEKNPTHVIVETNGIGYWIHISLTTYSQLPVSEEAFLYTYLSVKEDSQTLYGFMSTLEREVYKLLISVSGIGVNTARTMLSTMSTEEIQQAIASGNVAAVQSVKGIGAKTAQKVIIDLKDKIIKTFGLSEETATLNNTNKDEALSALETLGFAKRQAEKVVDGILKSDRTILVEKLIKQALKQL